jgi:hypothetical protein
MSWFAAKSVRVVLLPLGLCAATVLGLGSYTETSDDHTLAWLFSGVLALKPVPSVPLYLHGYGHLLAAAYAARPTVPWLGMLLALLLLAATVLTFAVLDRLLRPHLRPWSIVLVLALFFGVAWLEHWLWFSHGRAALLLAGAGVLFAAQRPGRRGALLVGLLALGAAWLVRPSVAVLGVAAVVPAAFLLAGGGRRAAPVLGSAALVLTLATAVLRWQQTPAEAAARQRDATLTRILDYEQLRPQPRTAADSLGTAAVGLWLLGDSTVLNEGLYQRAYRFEAARFLGQTVAAKLQLRLGLLVRDYFPLLLALAATAFAVGRRRLHQGHRGWFWLVQAGFGGGLLVLAGLLKLPPRLALPLLDFWLLTNLVYWLKAVGAARAGAAWQPPDGQSRRMLSPLGQWLGAAIGLVVIGLYGGKTWHRHQVLSRERQQHEAALDDIAHREAGRVRILAGTNDLLKSLSPFHTYRLGRQPVLLLTGWPSHDASQAGLRRALSGSAGQTECLRRLAGLETYGSEAQVLWVLTPATARWLNRRFRADGPPLTLYSQNGLLFSGADSAMRKYHVRDSPKQ